MCLSKHLSTEEGGGGDDENSSLKRMGQNEVVEERAEERNLEPIKEEAVTRSHQSYCSFGYIPLFYMSPNTQFATSCDK